MAKHNLQLDQVVYLEFTSTWLSTSNERKIIPATVVDLNKSSGYAISHDSMERNPEWKDKKYLRYRFDLKKLIGKTTFEHFKVWLSEEEFNQDKIEMAKRKDIRKQASDKFSKLSFDEMKRFLEEF